MVEFPFEFTRTFPELDSIEFVGSEEMSKSTEDSDGMNLERVRTRVEDFFGHMNGVRDDDDFGYVIQRTRLVDATSNSK